MLPADASAQRPAGAAAGKQWANAGHHDCQVPVPAQPQGGAQCTDGQGKYMPTIMHVWHVVVLHACSMLGARQRHHASCSGRAYVPSGAVVGGNETREAQHPTRQGRRRPLGKSCVRSPPRLLPILAMLRQCTPGTYIAPLPTLIVPPRLRPPAPQLITAHSDMRDDNALLAALFPGDDGSGSDFESLAQLQGGTFKYDATRSAKPYRCAAVG